MYVQIVVVGGDLNVEVVKGGPVLAITIAPTKPMMVENTGQLEPGEFDPWFEGHNFGWYPDN